MRFSLQLQPHALLRDAPPMGPNRVDRRAWRPQMRALAPRSRPLP
jgi:hypothetical protein